MYTLSHLHVYLLKLQVSELEHNVNELEELFHSVWILLPVHKPPATVLSNTVSYAGTVLRTGCNNLFHTAQCPLLDQM
jgi:hypothetical protein